jgi:Ca2+-binding EF-hand superfamily protein
MEDMMKRIFSLSLLTVILVFGISLAFAGYGYHHKGMMTSWDMSAVDTNKDSQLTFEEYSAKQIEHMRAGFDMIDTDKDGVISEKEWNALLKVHGVENPS